jgi:hypothetical protein
LINSSSTQTKMDSLAESLGNDTDSKKINIIKLMLEWFDEMAESNLLVLNQIC